MILPGNNFYLKIFGGIINKKTWWETEGSFYFWKPRKHIITETIIYGFDNLNQFILAFFCTSSLKEVVQIPSWLKFYVIANALNILLFAVLILSLMYTNVKTLHLHVQVSLWSYLTKPNFCYKKKMLTNFLELLWQNRLSSSKRDTNSFMRFTNYAKNWKSEKAILIWSRKQELCVKHLFVRKIIINSKICAA